jgi:hypothetical protein
MSLGVVISKEAGLDAHGVGPLPASHSTEDSSRRMQVGLLYALRRRCSCTVHLLRPREWIFEFLALNKARKVIDV